MPQRCTTAVQPQPQPQPQPQAQAQSPPLPPPPTPPLTLAASSTTPLITERPWRLLGFCCPTSSGSSWSSWSQTVRLRRRVPTAVCQLPAAQRSASVPTCYQPALASLSSALMLLLLLVNTCSVGAASPCDSQSWWDPVRDKCIACTICQDELIPLRPCQLHRDTICGSIYDLKIDWVVLAKTEPNWKERRKDELNYSMDELQQQQQQQQQHLHQHQQQQFHEEVLPHMDWQTAALFVAVLACLLFFIVAACILVHHMRQWRRMERRLDQDVEELSTKLMAKLAEVQSLEGGTFFIGSADALRVPSTFQPQHVLLPAEKGGKQHERRVLRTLQPGNVYIESSAKG